MKSGPSHLRYPLLALWLVAVAACSPTRQSSLPDFADLAEQVTPSVVNIYTRGGRAPGLREALPSPFDEDEEGRAEGSGFVLWADGHILTNRHVIAGAREIVVRLHDHRELLATVVGEDPRSDLALLRVEARDLPAVRIGDSERLRVGEWVLAVGSPFGLEHTVTAGIVSAKQRSLASEQYVPYIQTDVAINQGNSGGPLFDLDGRVIGINSQIYSQTGGFMGISFAIPIDVAVRVAEQLRDGGAVSRGWLGVVIQEVTRELAQSFELPRRAGALVTRVMPDSPAERAGLRVGDVILEFDGVLLPHSERLPQLVGASVPGRRVPLRVLRDGRDMTLAVEIGELAKSDEEVWASPTDLPPPAVLGLQVAPLSAEDREREQVLGAGVRVLDVGPGAALDAGVRRGDVILSLAGTEIDSPQRLDEVAARLTPGRSVPLLVQRRGSPLFLALVPPAS